MMSEKATSSYSPDGRHAISRLLLSHPRISRTASASVVSSPKGLGTRLCLPGAPGTV